MKEIKYPRIDGRDGRLEILKLDGKDERLRILTFRGKC